METYESVNNNVPPPVPLPKKYIILALIIILLMVVGVSSFLLFPRPNPTPTFAPSPTAIPQPTLTEVPIATNTPIPKITTTIIPTTTFTPTPTLIPTITKITMPTNYNVKVLILSYLPPDSSGTNVDKSITGNGDPIEKVRSWINIQNQETIKRLTEGTKYKGYKDTTALPAINYSIIDSKEFLKPVPVKFWTNRDNGSYYADYETMLTQDVSICDYVDKQGVKDVWIWGYQTNRWEGNKVVGVGILESNMAMGLRSKKYWQFGTYGNISNNHWKAGGLDMPQCERTYVTYIFNYNGYLGYPNMMHDYFHQIENELGFADRMMFWDMYGGKQYGFSGPRRCGNAHAPPNSNVEYKYDEKTFVSSDCEDWQPINCISFDINAECGNRKQINCDSWGCTDTGFYVWWMQNIPGNNNNLKYQGKTLRNWWDFMGDFDLALQNGQTLTE